MNIDTMYGKSSQMPGRSLQTVHLLLSPRNGQGSPGPFLMKISPSLVSVLRSRKVSLSEPDAAASLSTSSGLMIMLGWWQHLPHISQGKRSL